MRRPLSPHVSIYRLPLNARLSITHRLAGLVVLLMVVLVGGVISVCSSVDIFPLIHHVMMSPWGRGIIWLLSGMIIYYMVTSVRYAFWSLGLGFDLPTARGSAYGVMALTVVLWASYGWLLLW